MKGEAKKHFITPNLSSVRIIRKYVDNKLQLINAILKFYFSESRLKTIYLKMFHSLLRYFPD